MTAAIVIVAWCVLALLGLEPLLLHTIGLPWALRALILLGLTAPVSIVLGLPFPLGLARARSGAMLPWAWALNGAFSVVATPLANLIAVHDGFDRVLKAAIVLYVFALITFPSYRKSLQWQPTSSTNAPKRRRRLPSAAVHRPVLKGRCRAGLGRFRLDAGCL